MAFSFFKKKNKEGEGNEETGPQIIVPPAAVPQSKKEQQEASIPTSNLSKPSLAVPSAKVPESPETASLSKPAIKAPSSLQSPPPAPQGASFIPSAPATKKLPLPKINLGGSGAGAPPAPPKLTAPPPQVAPGDLSSARLPQPGRSPVALPQAKSFGSQTPLIKKTSTDIPAPATQDLKAPAIAAPAPLSTPAPAVGSVEIPLSLIAKSIPEDLVKPGATELEGTHTYDARKLTEQLSLGKVTLTIGEISQFAPQLLLDPAAHHDQPVNLPLGEVLKIAPKGLLQKRADQIEEKIVGEDIPTPFTEIAKKDALKTALPATPSTPPPPIQPKVSATPPPPAPAAEEKMAPKPFAPPIPRTTPISEPSPTTAPPKKGSFQSIPAIPISTVMLNKPGSGKPTIPIAPATTPISKSILTPSQRGVQPPSLLNKVSPSSLGATPTAKSLLPTPPQKTPLTAAPAPTQQPPAAPVTTPPAPAVQNPPETVVAEISPEKEVESAPPAQKATPEVTSRFEFSSNLEMMLKKSGITGTGAPALCEYFGKIGGVKNCIIGTVSGNLILASQPSDENQLMVDKFVTTYSTKILRHTEPLGLGAVKKITLRAQGNKNISVFRSNNLVMLVEHDKSQLSVKSSVQLHDLAQEIVNSLS